MKQTTSQRELGHALACLGDGSGEGRVWGPGVVGHKLWRRAPKAAEAFDIAAQVSFRLQQDSDFLDLDTKKCIRQMRRLAPVILGLLEEEEEEGDESGA